MMALVVRHRLVPACRARAIHASRLCHELRDGVIGDAVVWEPAAIGTNADQYCCGCGVMFHGVMTEASRCTKDVYPGRPLGRLCSRCISLDAENLSAASDEVRDVKVEDFVECMEGVLQRGPAMCVKIVDATDSEATSIGSILRAIIGEREVPIVLAVNKVDLLPRFDESHLDLLRQRVEAELGLPCLSAHAVSAVTGAGVGELAAAVAGATEKRNVIVCGAASVGKSTLINQLAHEVAARCAERDEKAKRAPPLTAFEKALQKMQAEQRAKAVAAGQGGGGPGLVKSGFSITLREEREDAVGRLRLTESPMPGTTLSAIAIPCLGSWRHQMFDTPGVLVPHALAYSLFPVHVLSPLMEPTPIAPLSSSPLELRPGESLVWEAAWLEKEEEKEEGGDAAGGAAGGKAAGLPCSMALARVDVCCVDGGGATAAPPILLAWPLASPSVRVRVVPTSEAPSTSRVPPAYLETLRQQFVAQGNHTDAKALGGGPYELPLGEEGTVVARVEAALDVAFSNLGWVAFYAPSSNSSTGGGRAVTGFEVHACPVQGSAAWIRQPPLYDFGTGSAQGVRDFTVK